MRFDFKRWEKETEKEMKLQIVILLKCLRNQRFLLDIWCITKCIPQYIAENN